MTDLTTKSAAELHSILNTHREANGMAPLKHPAPKAKMIQSIQDFEGMDADDAPVEEPEAVQETTNACPNGDECEWETAEGTSPFLVNFETCKGCGRSRSKLTGEFIELPTTPKKKRKLKNPQYKINAKVKAAEDEGAQLFYDRDEQVWTLIPANAVDTTRDTIYMSSDEFSKYGPKDIKRLLED